MLRWMVPGGLVSLRFSRRPAGGDRVRRHSRPYGSPGAVAARAQKLQRSRGATTGASCSSAQSKSSADGADAGCPMVVRVMNESGTTAKNTGWTRSYSILWRTFAKLLRSCGSTRRGSAAGRGDIPSRLRTAIWTWILAMSIQPVRRFFFADASNPLPPAADGRLFRADFHGFTDCLLSAT